MKKLFLVCLFCLGLAGSVCAASMAASQMAIGGLSPSNTAEEVVSLYGDPDRVENARGGPEDTNQRYWYGNFSVLVSSVGQVMYIDVKDSRLTTPDGVGVGMDASVLQTTYGEPRDTSYRKADGSLSNMVYRDAANTMIMNFHVNADGMIDEITLGSR